MGCRILRTCFSFAIFVLWIGSGSAADVPIAGIAGRTMGTTYSVRVVDPPDDLSELRFAIDAELRRVNSEMSTYLKSSEISRFNRSESTDWFDVSPSFAEVVTASLQLARRTGGAFDPTIGPYIDLWNFGAAERTGAVPSEEALAGVSEAVGWRKLHVRDDPPAIRKDVAGLSIDLSAIAKGHGVDRVVELLGRMGHDNVFVEIGGEVRVAGDKHGEPWRVGIQKPDSTMSDLMVAHQMSEANLAMATSGDYRNFFEVGGVRYSHMIDPRTRRPVTHRLASVSVVDDSCMMADGWATALTVLGDREGADLAAANRLSALLISRGGDGELISEGFGVLQQYAEQTVALAQTGDGTSIGPMFAITALFFGGVLAAMAVGVMFGRHAISGSCGGIAGKQNEDGSVSCSLCDNPADACKDLRERMKKASAGSV